MTDRLKGPLKKLARHADPLFFFRSLYRARVIGQSSDRRLVDVVPEDDRLPTMTSVPLRSGVPGMTVKLRLHDSFGTAIPVTVLVGWENASPTRPFAALWEHMMAPDCIERISVPVHAIIEIGGTDLDPLRDGVLTGQSIDPFTSLPHWQLGNASPTVLAKGKEP